MFLPFSGEREAATHCRKEQITVAGQAEGYPTVDKYNKKHNPIIYILCRLECRDFPGPHMSPHNR